MGTAQLQGELWGAKAADWSQVQEPAWRPVFEMALGRAGVRPGTRLLDVGCGAGGALAMARGGGAEVTGIDGAKNLVDIARRRLPGARIEIGDMEALPFASESFDVVIGINSFPFADNLGRALAEARRVCRRGGAVFMLTWGRPEDCELMTVTMRKVLALLPPPPASTAPGPMADPATVERALRNVGLEPTGTDEFAAELGFADATTAVRAVMSAGMTVQAARLAGEEIVARTIRDSLPAVLRSDGTVSWRNQYRWFLTRRPQH